VRVVRIFLATNEHLATAIEARLAPYPDLNIISWAGDESDLLLKLHRELSRQPQSPDDPIVVITSEATRADARRTHDRLITYFPEIIGYDIHLDVQPESITRYRRSIEECMFTHSDGLVADLRALPTATTSDPYIVPSRSDPVDR